MIADEWLRWVVTAIFVSCSGYCAYRLMIRGRCVSQIDFLFHLLMSLAMVAMAWPSGTGIPAGPQIAVFFAAAVFLIVQATLAGGSKSRQWVFGAHGHGRGALWYHAFMMLAMVGMVAMMGETAAWLGPVAVATAIVFAYAAVRWLVVVLLPPHRRRRLVEHVYESLMASGMAAMFFAFG